MLASLPFAWSDLYRSAQEKAYTLQVRWLTPRNVRDANPMTSKDLLSSPSLVRGSSSGEIHSESYIPAPLQLVSVKVCPMMRVKVMNAFMQRNIVQIEAIDHNCENCAPSPQSA